MEASIPFGWWELSSCTPWLGSWAASATSVMRFTGRVCGRGPRDGWLSPFSHPLHQLYLWTPCHGATECRSLALISQVGSELADIKLEVTPFWILKLVLQYLRTRTWNSSKETSHTIRSIDGWSASCFAGFLPSASWEARERKSALFMSGLCFEDLYTLLRSVM